MMKRFATALLALLLLAGIPACAEPERSTTADGMTYYGMLQDGQPVGFVALESAGGERLSFGVMDASGWQGSLYTVVKDDAGALARMMVTTYQAGVCTTSLHCMRDGTVTLFTYENGQIVSSLVRKGDTATAYRITDGIASDPQAVSVKSLEDGALYPRQVTLVMQEEEDRTLYCVTDHDGEAYIAVQTYADGSAELVRYLDGQATRYSAGDNTCVVGRYEDGKWLDGAMMIDGEGTVAPYGH